jgi:hypothetical protein
MARLFQSGWELNSSTDWGALSGATYDSTFQRSGLYSGKADATAAAQRFQQTVSAGSECYARLYVYISGTPSARSVLTSMSDSGGSVLISVILNTDLTIDVSSNGSVRGTSTATLATGTWVRLEVYYKTSLALAAATIVRLDGTEILNVSGWSTTATNMATMTCGPSAATGITYWFDDVAINSTAGSLNNSWPGAGAIALIVPSADTATINWTATGGGSHFSQIDDVPGTIDTTTYISTTSTTLNLEDRWSFSDLGAEVDAAATIAAVIFSVQGGGTGTTSRTAKFQARDGSGNTVDGTDVDWNLNGFKLERRILVSEQTWEGSPAALTKAYVNGIQGAAIDTNTNNREIRWTAVWATVDYNNPAPGGGGSGHRLCLLGVGR